MENHPGAALGAGDVDRGVPGDRAQANRAAEGVPQKSARPTGSAQSMVRALGVKGLRVQIPPSRRIVSRMIRNPDRSPGTPFWTKIADATIPVLSDCRSSAAGRSTPNSMTPRLAASA